MSETLRPPVGLLSPSLRGAVGQLAEALTEPNGELIHQIVAVIGPARALAYLAETLAQEAAGGVSSRDCGRRRTPNGAFFNRVRPTVRMQERWRIWPHTGSSAAPTAHCTLQVGRPPRPSAGVVDRTRRCHDRYADPDRPAGPLVSS